MTMTMARLRYPTVAINVLLAYVIGQQALSFSFLAYQHQPRSTTTSLLASKSTSLLINDDEISTKTSFTSPKFRVYIEDTDAYGVIYNSNYIRQYERAFTHVPSDDSTERKQWVMIAITNQKFRSSPTLGSEYIVTGKLVESLADNKEVWQMEMTSVPTDDDGNADVVVYNSATVTFASTPLAYISPLEEQMISSSEMYHKQSFSCYPDEFDIHSQATDSGAQTQQYAYHIPIRSASNFFERHRTTYLGGPDKLRKLQEEDGILFVVTALDDGEIFLDALDSTNHVGKDVIVETKFVVKRRGMVTECHHRLYMNMDADEAEDNAVKSKTLLAKATMTMMTLDKRTYRPTSKLPEWLMILIKST